MLNLLFRRRDFFRKPFSNTKTPTRSETIYSMRCCNCRAALMKCFRFRLEFFQHSGMCAKCRQFSCIRKGLCTRRQCEWYWRGPTCEAAVERASTFLAEPKKTSKGVRRGSDTSSLNNINCFSFGFGLRSFSGGQRLLFRRLPKTLQKFPLMNRQKKFIEKLHCRASAQKPCFLAA